MDPYKIRISQAITESDVSQRMELAQLIIANMKMFDNILWTDEAYFIIDACVNRQNAVIWASELPTYPSQGLTFFESLCFDGNI